MPSASSRFDLDSGHSTSSAPPTTGAADQRIHRTVRWLQVVAWTVAASVGLLLPVLYWMQQTRMLDTALQIETEQLAASLSKQAARVPDRWMYRLNALKAELAVVTERGVSNAIRLNNARGQELVAVGTWRLNLQHSTRSEVMDSGVHVATVELQTDLRPAAVEALKAAIVGAVLAWLVWWSMARLALGGLRAAFEELQSARDVAQSANRAKSAFLAAMSHEIRTPMNGVLGMAELLSHSPLDAEQAQTVTTVRESAQSLLRIIDDILDFSKIEAGRLELEAEPLLMTPLVEGTCDALAAVAAAREVQLWACVEPGVPERVLSDAVRIRQVLTNLIGNAIKFSAGHSARRGRVEVRVSPAEGGVRFAVRDNGIGMDAAAVARLFTPFVQAEASTTRRYGGTGIGLAISHRLVKLLGGRIDVTSTPDEGSRFTVWLPLAEHGEQPAAPTLDLNGVQVLLVDQHGLPCADVDRWLARAGARVHALPDIDTAHLKARTLPPPVVIVRDGGCAGPAPLDDHLGDIRELVVGHGRRGPARLVSPTMATLDMLHRMPMLRAVAMLAGRASPETLPAAQDDLVRNATPLLTVAQARAQRRLILVAEDDAVNRLVVTRQLALLGHAAEVADNGASALVMWRSGDYALLLTDLHMPELDGYALARAIRDDEAQSGRARQPILALTANALKGEAARARAAGIDDYLTKPASLKLLQAALKQWLPASAGPTYEGNDDGSRDGNHGGSSDNGNRDRDGCTSGRSDVAQPASAGADNVLSLRVLRELVGDDELLIEELRLDFLQQCYSDGQALHDAVLGGNRLRVQAIAHRLKSAARSVGALALGDLCEQLEHAPASMPGRAAQAQSQALLALLQRTQAALVAAGGQEPHPRAHPGHRGPATSAGERGGRSQAAESGCP